MKILYFGGGLGNQIFEYFFYLYLQKKYPDEKIYGVYNKKKLSEHNGLEINKWFNVQLPVSNKLVTLLTYILYIYKKVVKRSSLLDLNTRKCENEHALVFNAYKYARTYLPAELDLEWLNIKERLSVRNKELLESIVNSNSYFVHVRKGDYLSPQYKATFEGTCPLSYYKQSIEDIYSKEENPRFYVFSDDMLWAIENLPLSTAVYVDWNTGSDSPIDMYLMSQCKGAVMANSTFSYWGALLGKKKKVYYPRKWINSAYGIPDLFFDDWISY